MTEQSIGVPPHSYSAHISNTLVYPPLAPWQVFLLCSITFTLYAPFWMYRAASDLEKLDTENRTKWLWFLSPLFGLSLLISVPRLLKRYDAVIDSEHWRKKAMNVAGLIFGGFMFMNLMEKLEIPDWFFLVSIALVSAGFAWLQVATNELKSHLEPEFFTRKAYSFSLVHWLTITLCSLLLIGFAYAVYFLDEEVEPGEPIPAATFVAVPETDVCLLYTSPSPRDRG